jgi:hypothetical protein
VFEATDLIGARARYDLCGFGDFNHCIVNYGSNELYKPYSREVARQQIIEASHQGCAAIAAVLPPAGCEMCLAMGGTCSPQAGCTFAPEDPTFCDARAVGLYCDDGRLIACDSGGGETVRADCEAGGTVCSVLSPIGNEPNAACQGAPPCSATPVCDGSVSRTCGFYQHCEDQALVCGASGSCEYAPPAEADAACRWGAQQPICAGDYVLECIGDRYFYTKCSDLGFTGGCTAATGAARCVP